MKPTIPVLPSLFLLAMTPAQAQEASLPRTNKAITEIPPKHVFLFPLQNVRLLPGPFYEAQEVDRRWLLRVDPDRMLSHMRIAANLKPKAQPYGGWEQGVAGQIGHYLSACANMTQATGDPEVRKKMEYVIAEMAECQKANGDGAVYENAGSRNWYKNLRNGELQTSAVVPWYVSHKVFAGLRDAWKIGGSTKAREILVKMCDWCVVTTAKLTEEQWQKMLDCEHGAPHEVLAEVYAYTKNREHLECAKKFRHNRVFEPLAKGDDSVLVGMHANTQIPKFTANEYIYQVSGEKVYHEAAEHFWEKVTTRHSWAIGGNSQWERFFDPNNFKGEVPTTCGPETCNTYNMLRLTKALYQTKPTVAHIDYYERALINHILPSQAPEEGGFVYYTSMRPGHYRVYSRFEDGWWCCTGTGMENHGKYGELIYAHNGKNRLFVNLYLASSLRWPEKNLNLRQETTFPENDRTRFTFTLSAPQKMTVALRYPSWVAPGAMTVTINGQPAKINGKPGQYAEISRLWRNGDKLDVTLPMSTRLEPLPNSTEYAAIFRGPVLMAGALGKTGLERGDFFGGERNPGTIGEKTIPTRPLPVMLRTAENKPPELVSVPGEPFAFRTKTGMKPSEVTLKPLYRLPLERYAVYFRWMTLADWEKENRTILAEEKQEAELDKITVDQVRIGEADSETAHRFQAQDSNSGPAGAPYTHWRDGRGWFEYEMKVTPGKQNALRCVFWGSDSGREFDVSVNGKVIASVQLNRDRPDEYLRNTYPIPAEWLNGKDTVTVRFSGKSGKVAGGLFDLRTITLTTVAAQ